MKTRSFLVIAFIIALVAGAGGLFSYLATGIAAQEGLPASAGGVAPGGNPPVAGSAPPDLNGLGKAAENEFLALYFSEKTTEVAVLKKKTGEVWYSNPPGRAADPLAAGINRQTGSQLSCYLSHPARPQKDDGQCQREY